MCDDCVAPEPKDQPDYPEPPVREWPEREPREPKEPIRETEGGRCPEIICKD